MDAARRHALAADGSQLQAAAANVLPAFVHEMTLAQFDALANAAVDPRIDPARAVVVVTMHGSMTYDARPGETVKVAPVYTDVYDASTGVLIVECVGVAAINS